MGTKRWTTVLLALALLAATAAQASATGTGTAGNVLRTTIRPSRAVLVGAASRSVLPTVGGTRDYLRETPGWDDDDPNDPGVFVPQWDQGRIGVDNGRDDSAWVHDDLLATALAIQRGDQKTVVVASDLYMVFAVDAAEIQRRARLLLPASWQQVDDPDQRHAQPPRSGDRVRGERRLVRPGRRPDGGGRRRRGAPAATGAADGGQRRAPLRHVRRP